MSAISTITLDHPVDIAGVVIRFVPVRYATRADAAEVNRAPAKLLRQIARQVAPGLAPGESVATAVSVLLLIRAITGLPVATLLQFEPDDTRKLLPYLKIAEA